MIIAIWSSTKDLKVWSSIICIFFPFPTVNNLKYFFKCRCWIYWSYLSWFFLGVKDIVQNWALEIWETTVYLIWWRLFFLYLKFQKVGMYLDVQSQVLHDGWFKRDIWGILVDIIIRENENYVVAGRPIWSLIQSASGIIDRDGILPFDAAQRYPLKSLQLSVTNWKLVSSLC